MISCLRLAGLVSEKGPNNAPIAGRGGAACSKAHGVQASEVFGRPRLSGLASE